MAADAKTSTGFHERYASDTAFRGTVDASREKAAKKRTREKVGRAIAATYAKTLDPKDRLY